MVSTYTANGGIEKIGSGEQSGTWGDTTNTNFDIIDQLINGVGAITLSGTSHTLTTSEGALSDGMFKVLVLGGSPSGTNTITISPNTADKLYFVHNTTSQTATFTQGSGASVNVLAGKAAIIFADGAGSGAAVTDLSALLPITSDLDALNIGATTPGTGAFTALTVDNVVVNGANIGHTDDTDLITLANGSATVAGQLTATGDLATSGTVIPSGDTASGDNAAIGFTSAEGIIITGQGSTNDVTIKNDADTTVIAIPTGGTGVSFAGTITTPSIVLNGVTVTSTAAELNILDGGTATTSELNIMDGVTATAAELSILDGVTSTASELNLVDGSSAGTIVNSKAVVYGSSGEVNATTLQIAGTSITSTAAELNIVDGDTSATSTTLVDADRVVVNDAGTMKQVAMSDVKTYIGVPSLTGAVTTIDTEDLTASRALVSNSSGKVAVSTVTSTELGYLSGVSSSIGTQLGTKHDSVGQGLQEDDATTVAMKNSWITNSATLHDTGTVSTYTNSTGYPVFISGRSTSTGNRSFTVTINGVGKTLDMSDGDSGTYDDLATVLPNGASVAVDSGSFTYMAVQMRPG